jgi:hypothetical protein
MVIGLSSAGWAAVLLFLQQIRETANAASDSAASLATGASAVKSVMKDSIQPMEMLCI